jgi:hypothetical protein
LGVLALDSILDDVSHWIIDHQAIPGSIAFLIPTTELPKMRNRA